MATNVQAMATSGNHLMPGRRMSVIRSTSAQNINTKSEVDDFDLFCAQAGACSPLPARKISGSEEYGGSMPCLARNHSVKVAKPKRDTSHLKYTLSLPTSAPLQRHDAVDKGSKEELHSPRGSAPNSPARTPSMRRRKGILGSIRNILEGPDIKENKENKETDKRDEEKTCSLSRRSSGSRSAPHSRQGSIRRPRKPRVNQELDGIRRRTNSMPTRRRPRTLRLNPDAPHLNCTPLDDNTRVRNFEITSKGIINRGDSFRSRSPSSLRSWGSSGSGVGEDGSPLDQDAVPHHRVLILGATGVGKTTLAQQFLSSDNVTELDTVEDELTTTTVSVTVDKQQKTLEVIDLSTNADYNRVPNIDAYVIVYSTDDRATYMHALSAINCLNSSVKKNKTIIMVANKTDLVRTREVSKKEGKLAAEAHKVKFVEVSAALNLQVDELLVGVITQIRLHQERNRSRRNQGDSALAAIGRFLRRQGTKFSKSSEDLQKL